MTFCHAWFFENRFYATENTETIILKMLIFLNTFGGLDLLWIILMIQLI